MKENYKLMTLRIDWEDYQLLKKAQENLKITSINTVIKQILYTQDSIYDFYQKSESFKRKHSNN